MCGGKEEVCGNNVTVFACQADPTDDDDDTVTSGEEEEAFVCETPGKFSGVVDKRGCSACAWQVGDIPVICDNGASCHMSYSSTGMLNYRETNASCVQRAVRDSRSSVTGIYS